jgi:L-arabinose isomerase
MSVRHDHDTLLSVVEDRERSFSLLVAPGKSAPGDALEIGNTKQQISLSVGSPQVCGIVECPWPGTLLCDWLQKRHLRLSKRTSLCNLDIHLVS